MDLVTDWDFPSAVSYTHLVIITKRCEKSHEIHFFFICDKIWTYFGVKAVPINSDKD